MTNVGRWAPWYRGMNEPWPYGDTTSYEIGAAWLADCALIEDWGCGAGWLSTLISSGRYRGIDGTASAHCSEVVDLVYYRSSVPAVFMRHILEHNYEWSAILDNALASFTERMVLILFTPNGLRPSRLHSRPSSESLTSPSGSRTSLSASLRT